MAVVMEMRWDGVTAEQYDGVRRLAGWITDPDPNGHLHVAWFDANALRCVDVWESEADFQRFFESRIQAAVKEVGMTGQPDVRFMALHESFVPRVGGAEVPVEHRARTATPV